MNGRAISLSLLFAGSLFAGCTGPQRAYNPEMDSSGGVAELRGFGVLMRRVNGIEIEPTTEVAHVLAGKNTVEFSIGRGNYSLRTDDPSVLTIRFNAEAGKKYIVTGNRGQGRLCVWEQSPATGQADTSRPAGCLEAEK